MNKLLFLLAPDPAAGNGNPPGGKKQADADRIAQLESENTALKTQIADLSEKVAAAEVVQKKLDEREKLINEKIHKGLTRAQAIAVIERQEAFDKHLAEQKAKAEADAAKKTAAAK